MESNKFVKLDNIRIRASEIIEYGIEMQQNNLADKDGILHYKLMPPGDGKIIVDPNNEVIIQYDDIYTLISSEELQYYYTVKHTGDYRTYDTSNEGDSYYLLPEDFPANVAYYERLCFYIHITLKNQSVKTIEFISHSSDKNKKDAYDFLEYLDHIFL